MLRGRDRTQFFCDAMGDHPRVVTPRHDVVEENVTMRDKHPAASEVEMVEVRKVGIVIATEKRHAGGVSREEILHRGMALGGVARIRAHARVEGVAIEYETRAALQEWTELRQLNDAAGVIAEVEV